MESIHVHPVIISGGGGTRLWPLSCKKKPKQFHPLTSDKTLLQEAYERAKYLGRIDRIYVSTVREFDDLVSEQVPNVSKENIIIEPAARDTMAAIGFVTKIIYDRDPDATIVIMPADHAIKYPADFTTAMRSAISIVESEPNRVALLAVNPTYANTQYGYMMIGNEVPNGRTAAFQVDNFIEKPDLKKAQEYFKDERCFWNGGYFVFRADTMLAYIQEHAQKLFDVLNKISDLPPESEEVVSIFNTLPKVSIDTGVVEKLEPSQIFCVPARCGWADVGLWSTLWEYCAKNPDDNISYGKVMEHECTGNIFYNNRDDVQVTALAVKDLVVVVSRNIVAIFGKEKSADVKEALQGLRGSRIGHISQIDSSECEVENHHDDFRLALYGVDGVTVIFKNNTLLLYDTE